MKTKIYLALVALSMTSFTSCMDVLDQTPTDRYTDAVVWNDETLVLQHLAQLYAYTPRYGTGLSCIGFYMERCNLKPR